jgi:ADP-ribose pyrophosphatase YjhB (NUDIX family)
VQHNGILPPPTPDTDPIAKAWDLPFNTAAVAVGGVVFSRAGILLVADGRWQGDKLTVPGTTVRPGETRDAALARALRQKFGLNVHDVVPFQTSFMADGSGYGKPVRQLVFDDRRIKADPRVSPQDGITAYWVPPSELDTLLRDDQLEPNAAALLAAYLVQKG